ncbi:MAG: FMN-binding glutamate synthase family protein [Deltaproteobacteria bacterium]|nr:FMN-binding glutamate synthase family protein [Deltaproteobacteria bacterium]
MELGWIGEWVSIVTLVLLIAMVAGPPVFLASIYLHDRFQSQHAVLRNFPLLGRLRYLFEHLGPEMRQYLFDGDREGKPFSRDDYTNIVLSGKYMKSIISFGSKRDFELPGWYLRNGMLPTLYGDLALDLRPTLETQRYVTDHDGLFSRSEHVQPEKIAPWALDDAHAPVIGPDLAHPWVMRGLMGMSGMSYGALGRHAIQALSLGLGKATGAWMNTGEGGLSPHHLVGGGPIVFQIGPGLFGVRNDDGEFDWELFRKQAAIPEVVAFELKLHQGAKIRGGHVEGEKVTPEIAEIRGVPVGQTIDSPARFPMLSDLDDLFDWIDRMRQEGGKPIGVKLVVGGPGSLDEFALAMSQRGDGPDFITVDGGEGGSGATYREMADSMGLPIGSSLIEADDAFRRAGVRDRVKIIASGKLFSADRIALALCFGADAVQIARGMMISVGCIQAQRCHNNTCPVGVATTDESLMKALVVEEKQYRVLNYITTLRAGLAGLTAAAGLHSPTEFTRYHAVHRDALGRIRSAADVFPQP